MGNELQEAFSVLHWLRVKAELGRQTDGTLKSGLQNMLDLNDLDRLEKDTLRNTFHVVKEFKKHLSLRYQLGGRL
jgi:CBS domain-containing protein